MTTAHKIANAKHDETVVTTRAHNHHGLSKAAVKLKKKANRVAKRKDKKSAMEDSDV